MRNLFVARLGAAVAAALLAITCGSATPPAEESTSATPAAAPGERGSPEQLKALASRPTPHLPDGRPDLNATWDHLGGIEFVRLRQDIPSENESRAHGFLQRPAV